MLAEGLTEQGDRRRSRAQPGSEARKVAIAREIWEKTTVNLARIAEHLWMRSAMNAGQQLWRRRLLNSKAQ